MNGTPQPALLAKEIRDDLSPLLFRGGALLNGSDFTIRLLLRRCEALQNSDAATASLIKAEVLQLVGDVSEVERWANNAVKLGATFEAWNTLCLCYSNLGYASKAASIFAETPYVTHGRVNDAMPLGIASGAFQAICKFAEELEVAGGSVGRKDLVMLARSVVDALSRLDVKESTLHALMDEAGVLLRGKNLLWLNDHPDVNVGGPGDGDFVAINYRVGLSPEDAAELTWVLAERVAEIGLLPPSVTVGFIGEGVASAGDH
jgi:hypothetical protein